MPLKVVERRSITPRERVEKEIRNHSKWCGSKCTSFSPTEYRKARLERNLPHEEAKKASHSK